MTVPDVGWVFIALAAVLVTINVVRDIRRQRQARR
jgi:hypothetical protein